MGKSTKQIILGVAIGLAVSIIFQFCGASDYTTGVFAGVFSTFSRDIIYGSK